MPFQPEYDVPEIRRAYTMLAEVDDEQKGNGRVGCLMLHGFMGSPVSTRHMAQFLAQNGITVHCPLLPGHGNLPHKLYKVSRQAWLAEAEEGLAHLRQLADHIFIMGHSMGAVLAAHLANRYPDIQGLVFLAPLYKVPDWRINLSGVAQYFMPWFYPLRHKDADNEIFLGRVTDFDPTVDVTDPALQDWLYEATRIPTSGTWEMVKTAWLGLRQYAKIAVPTLILQGEQDAAVKPGNARAIYELIPHDNKRLVMLPQTGHELMRPFAAVHQQVWQTILAFVQQPADVTVLQV